ncbi:uncharacterized protein isoform X1 [Choristoneura fumiferana]|uniref:uncharacterized protein isoform X1 n=2 Tax=Choristoneura fumiferana TaxID=7141 RepID=UPI003D15CCD9
MAKNHFCLSSNTYKNNVFKGFSELQQSDEFVDMTLAAGDQFVKVHKTLIALASPYLKVLLQAIPCQHPVLFLSNIKHEDLHFILEYIYTGEVNIPPEKLQSFLIAAQAMHIRGLETIVLPAGNETNDEPRKEKQTTQVKPVQLYQSTKIFPVVKANITINQNDFNLQVEPNTQIPINNNSENNYPLLDLNNEPAPEENVDDLNAGTDTDNINSNLGNEDDNANNDFVNNLGITNNPITPIISENIDCVPNVIDEIPENLQRPFLNIGKETFTVTNTGFNNSKIDVIATPKSNAVNQDQANDADGVKDKDSILYTISSRGSLQLIMNRFMYYCHYTRDGGRKRRWRCIEYRDKHCPAAIDTEEDTIVARKQKHSHPNHDHKIWYKVVKSRVFSSLRMAQDTIKEKQSLPKPVVKELILSD